MVYALSAAVFGVACTYTVKELDPFVKSLRATGFDGAVHLGVDPDLETRELLRAHAVTVHAEPCREALTSRERSAAWRSSRSWAHYRSWLSSGGYDAAWIVDPRDVVFQAHPFATQVPDLALFAETPELNALQRVEAAECLGIARADLPNVVEGMVLGSSKGLNLFIDHIAALSEDAQRRGSPCLGGDAGDDVPLSAAALARFVRAHGPAGAGAHAQWVLYEPRHGPAMTMSAPCDSAGEQDAIGRLINAAGDVAPVLHKWGRCHGAKWAAANGALRMALGQVEIRAEKLLSEGKAWLAGGASSGPPAQRMQAPSGLRRAPRPAAAESEAGPVPRRTEAAMPLKGKRKNKTASRLRIYGALLLMAGGCCIAREAFNARKALTDDEEAEAAASSARSKAQKGGAAGTASKGKKRGRGEYRRVLGKTSEDASYDDDDKDDDDDDEDEDESWWARLVRAPGGKSAIVMAVLSVGLFVAALLLISSASGGGGEPAAIEPVAAAPAEAQAEMPPAAVGADLAEDPAEKEPAGAAPPAPVAPPEGAPCEGQHVLGELGANACPEGANAITTSDECANAAATVGKLFGGQTQGPKKDRPKGCYAKGQMVAFNPDTEGGGYSLASPVCQNGPECAKKESAAAAAMYVYATEGDKACPVGTSAVTTAEACTNAASLLLTEYGGAISKAENPKGCFSVGTATQLNEVEESAETVVGKLVCMQEAPAPGAEGQPAGAADSKQGYHLAPAGSPACAADANIIRDKATCRFAGKEFGLAWWGVQSEEDRPKGCFKKGQRVIWNVAETGGPNPEDQPICLDIVATPSAGLVINQQLGQTVDGLPTDTGGMFYVPATSKVCPPGSRPVKDQVGCALASKLTGVVYQGVVSDPLKPKGCFREDEAAAWNEDPVGKSSHQAHLICRYDINKDMGRGSSGRADLVKKQKKSSHHSSSHHSSHGGD